MFDWDKTFEDDSKCLVCKVNMGKSQDLICSPTCVDIYNMTMLRENDCAI